MYDSFSHTSSRKRRVMRRRFSQNYIQITKTTCVNPKHIIYLSVRVIASDESRTRHGGIALLHRNHEVGEVSGRRVSKAGRKRLFHSPSPRAKHPNPRSRIHERPRIHEEAAEASGARRGRKWMTPFHTPQAESGGL